MGILEDSEFKVPTFLPPSTQIYPHRDGGSRLQEICHCVKDNIQSVRSLTLCFYDLKGLHKFLRSTGSLFLSSHFSS